jgi:hypothetical protein
MRLKKTGLLPESIARIADQICLLRKKSNKQAMTDCDFLRP